MAEEALAEEGIAAGAVAAEAWTEAGAAAAAEVTAALAAAAANNADSSTALPAKLSLSERVPALGTPRGLGPFLASGKASRCFSAAASFCRRLTSDCSLRCRSDRGGASKADSHFILVDAVFVLGGLAATQRQVSHICIYQSEPFWGSWPLFPLYWLVVVCPFLGLAAFSLYWLVGHLSHEPRHLRRKTKISDEAASAAAPSTSS